MAEPVVSGWEDSGEHGRKAVDVGCGTGEADQFGGHCPNAEGGGGEKGKIE